MDQCLLFHGTSNIYEESISKIGLCPSKPRFDLPELERVAAIFSALNWSGIHGGGFAVLQAFSIMHDHGHKGGTPIYLAESAQRASLFATKDFAGGEICRALNYCMEDLDRYISEKEVRDEHANRLEGRPGLHRVEKSAIPTLDWVCSEVEKLSETKDMVESIRRSFKYGIIYSVRLDEDKLDEIHYHNSMGIKSFRSITGSEIEDKYRLPASFHETIGEDKKWLNAIFEPGIVMTIRDRNSEATKPPE